MLAVPDGTKAARFKQRNDLGLPELPHGSELYVEALEVMGFYQSNGWGPVPLPFSEIVAACPWVDERDRRLMRSMSEAFVSGTQMTDPLARPPFEPEG